MSSAPTACSTRTFTALAPSPAANHPLGHGFLTGAIRSPEQFAADDWRRTSPRFQGENFRRNLALADQVRAVADEAGATPAQVALAWLPAKGEHIVPIPGTKQVTRVEEDTAADGVELTQEQIATLDNLPPAAGSAENDEARQRIER